MEENKKPHNPPAFPNANTQERAGMTLRDYFAAKAMQSLVIKTTERKLSIYSKILIFFGCNGWSVDYDLSEINISKSAYSIADEMLKQRKL